MKNFVFIILILNFCSLCYAQTEVVSEVMPELAAAKMRNGNYEDALSDYLQLLNTDSRNELYNYNVGICYLNSNTNKAKAIPYLEIVTRKNQYNHEADYLLARAYHFGGRYDDAIKMFENYKLYLLNQGKVNPDINIQIQYCQNAKELVKFPVDVTFQSLGSNVNSAYDDFFPFVTSNESVIYYNTKRPEKNAEKLANGEFGSSIYYSKVENGEYSKALPIGALINKGNSGMEIIGLSANGDIMLLSNSNATGKVSVFISIRNNQGEYSKPELLDKMINSGGDVIAASISGDGNTIYFTSSKSGGYGGLDLYSCNKLSTGKWAAPQNLGEAVNTKEDEDFPNISSDGKTLYFSSKGHVGMGGYDIFKTEFDESKKKFSNAKNIGFPINTTYDDMNFRVSENGKFGYIAAIKPNGLGENDIYRVNFNDIESDYTIIIGNFKANIPDVNYNNFFISVNDSKTNELVGNYIPNPVTGRYIMILPPGKYQMLIEAPGFKNIEKEIEILDKASYQSEINMSLELTK